MVWFDPATFVLLVLFFLKGSVGETPTDEVETTALPKNSGLEGAPTAVSSCLPKLRGSEHTSPLLLNG